jgi:hypothetical protein
VGEKMDAIVYLFRDSSGWFAITGTKTLIITIGTPSPPFIPVAVGTGEAGVDGYLLYFEGEFR